MQHKHVTGAANEATKPKIEHVKKQRKQEMQNAIR